MSKGGWRPNSGRKKGSVPWNKGLPMSEESKKKLSAAKVGQPSWNKGKRMSNTMREKMHGNLNGKGNKGRNMSKEWIEKIRLAKIGKPSPLKGRKISEEHRKKLIGRKVSKEQRQKASDARIAAYKRDFPDYVKSDNTHRRTRQARRRRLLEAGGLHSRGEWETLKAQYNFTCPSCKKSEPEIRLTRDHIIPVFRGGSDNIENIQPLCKLCNSRKHLRTIKY